MSTRELRDLRTLCDLMYNDIYPGSVHLTREKETTTPTTIMACRSNGIEHPWYPLKARHGIGMTFKRADKWLCEYPL